MRKRWLFLTAVLLMTLLILGGACAGEDWSRTNEETGYTAVIEDAAGLLSADEMTRVMEKMMSVTAYANAGFYTYPSGGKSTASGESKAREWGNRVFGASVRYTVFIIDMRTRHLDIWASQPLLPTLTSSYSNTIADNVYRYASRGDYAGCAEETFTEIEAVLRGEKIAAPMKIISNVLIALIAAILASYLLISAWMRKEQEITMPDVVKAAGIGAATVITAQRLKKVVHHQSGSGGHGGGGGFGGGGGGGGGGHGF